MHANYSIEFPITNKNIQQMLHNFNYKFAAKQIVLSKDILVTAEVEQKITRNCVVT